LLFKLAMMAATLVTESSFRSALGSARLRFPASWTAFYPAI